MSLNDLNSEQRELAELISEISEHRYRAGWMSGIEAELWQDLVASRPQNARRGLSVSDAERLKELSDRCGGWIVWDDRDEETFLHMDDWLARCDRGRDAER